MLPFPLNVVEKRLLCLYEITAVLRYGNHFFHLGNFLLQKLLNTHLKRHRRHGTGPASAFEPHFDDSIFLDAHELNITAISLEGGSYFLECFFDFFFHNCVISLVELE